MRIFSCCLWLLLVLLPVFSVADTNDTQTFVSKAQKLEQLADNYIRLADNNLRLATILEKKIANHSDKPEQELAKWRLAALEKRQLASSFLRKAQQNLQEANSLREQYLKQIPLTKRDRLRIGSWNIQNFGESKLQEEIFYQGKLTLLAEVIAEIIKAGEYDILAIQEVEGDDLDPIQKVVDILNQGQETYRMTYPEKLGKSVYRAEYLPIIYNDRLLKFHNQGNLKDLEMQRAPHYAKFSLRPGFFENPASDKNYFDFVLVSVHMAPKKYGDEDLPRQKDFDALPKIVRELHKKFQREDVIIAGDFNCDPTASRGADWKLWKEITAELGPVAPFTIINEGEEDLAESSMVRGDRVNDNIIWNSTAAEDWARVKRVYPFVKKHFDGDIDLAREVSDHLPVWAEFYPNQDTD